MWGIFRQIKKMRDAVRADMRRARWSTVFIHINGHRATARAEDHLPRRITVKAAGSGAMAGQQQGRCQKQGDIPSHDLHLVIDISGPSRDRKTAGTAQAKSRSLRPYGTQKDHRREARWSFQNIWAGSKIAGA